MADESGRVALGTTVRGSLRGEGTFVVEGAVEGQVILQHDALVAAGGRIHGEVKARTVDVSGRVEGRVETGQLQVRASGALAADLVATEVIVEDGATIQGYLQMPLDLPSDLAG